MKLYSVALSSALPFFSQKMRSDVLTYLDLSNFNVCPLVKACVTRKSFSKRNIIDSFHNLKYLTSDVYVCVVRLGGSVFNKIMLGQVS